MKKAVLFIFSLFILTNTFTQSFQDTIPFRNDLGLIIIPVKFNDVEKQFAFDTGAQYSVAYGWAAKTLKKTRRTITVNSSSGLKSKMRFYKSGKINIGSKKIKGHKILNTSENEIFTCYNVDGILGVDIIKAFNWTIDYKKKILIMHPSNFVPKNVEDMHQLDFNFIRNRPYIYLNLKKNNLRFLLDTGAGSYSNISKRNYNLTNLENYTKRSFYSGSFDVNGILTSSKPVVIKLKDMRSKNVTFSPLIYYNNKKSTKIGNRLWKDKQLFVSLKNKQLYVSDTEINQDYKGFPCSVMYFKNKMRIMRIEIGSDLWNSGIRQGDEVLKFNGKSFNNFCDLNQYQRKLLQTKNTFTITLLSGKSIAISKTENLKKQ